MPKNIQRETLQIVKSQRLTANCRSIAFLRLAGSDPATVDGFPLQDGVSMEFSLFPGETDIHSYRIVFENGVNPKMIYVFKEKEVV